MSSSAAPICKGQGGAQLLFGHPKFFKTPPDCLIRQGKRRFPVRDSGFLRGKPLLSGCQRCGQLGRWSRTLVQLPGWARPRWILPFHGLGRRRVFGFRRDRSLFGRPSFCQGRADPVADTDGAGCRKQKWRPRQEPRGLQIDGCESFCELLFAASDAPTDKPQAAPLFFRFRFWLGGSCGGIRQIVQRCH